MPVNSAVTPNPLMDRFGRVHENLRVSITDRCNIRCFYCMPDENLQFKHRDELLSYEEIATFVAAAVGIGIHRVRITGGEPLVRADVPKLIQMLRRISGLQDIAMTTNGMLLAQHAQALRDAGLDRLNVSLDTLREDAFFRISRRRGLQKVIDGIFAARAAGFTNIRLNAVAIAGITDDDIVPLGEFARSHDLELRFIEFMPLDGEQHWTQQLVMNGASIRDRLEQAFGALEPRPRPDPSQPAVDYQFADGRGRIGFINPVSEPFCESCNRLRITAEGQLRNCLFSSHEWDARALLRSEADELQLQELMRSCVAAKKPSHGIDRDDFERPKRAMYQIGG